jgi:hypothetical protein
VTRELLLREGDGRKGSPLRYWLPDQEEKWKDDPLHELHESIWQANLGAWEEGDGGESPAAGGS